MQRTPRHTERAFTLIELMVGMILLAVAIALVGTALVQAISGSASSTAGVASDAAIARTVARFQDDLAVAETSDRTARLVREQATLDAALREGRSAPSDDPTQPRPGGVDLDDVLTANPKEFRIQADVDRTQAGAECVTWEAVPTGNKYEVRRTVRTQGCGGVTETEVLMSGRLDASGAVPEPFSYRLVCNRSLCNGSASPSGCTPWVRTTVGGTDRRWIVGVRAQFVANTGRTAVNSRSGTTINIRSREEHMWRTALGC